MSASYYEELLRKIKVLNESIWDRRSELPRLEKWLANFETEPERLIALHLLSEFLYFGNAEIRRLLLELFNDLFKYPRIRDYRRTLGKSITTGDGERYFRKVLDKTRILGLGNPSESGHHLLYFLRQEASLASSTFTNVDQLFTLSRRKQLKLNDTTVENYIFVDDFCGSGEQATRYSKDPLIKALKRLAPQAKLYYFVLFATVNGIRNVENNSSFDEVRAVIEFDESHQVLESGRYFANAPPEINTASATALAVKYGLRLWPDYPLGFDRSQMLLGFYHNTPDNTLPIIWSKGHRGQKWDPIFARYGKF